MYINKYMIYDLWYLIYDIYSHQLWKKCPHHLYISIFFEGNHAIGHHVTSGRIIFWNSLNVLLMERAFRKGTRYPKNKTNTTGTENRMDNEHKQSWMEDLIITFLIISWNHGYQRYKFDTSQKLSPLPGCQSPPGIPTRTMIGTYGSGMVIKGGMTIHNIRSWSTLAHVLYSFVFFFFFFFFFFLLFFFLLQIALLTIL